MDFKMSRILLSFLRILQCSSSLIVGIIEIFQRTEMEMNIHVNTLELFYEYCVMNLGFVTSALYVCQFNRRLKRGPYKYDIFIDCVLMNAWMIFSILRLSPQFDKQNVLTCGQHENRKYIGCIIYVSTLALGFFITALYFSTSIICAWMWIGRNPLITNDNTNPDSNDTDPIYPINPTNPTNGNSPTKLSSLLNRTGLNRIRNSQSHSIPEIITQEEGEIRNLESISLKEFIEHNKHLTHLFKEDSEFNRTDGTIVVLRKPSPSFLRYEQRENGSNYNKNRYTSEYSLDSSFSRTYGSIIIPRKNSLTTDNSSTSSKYDGTIIIGRNQIISTYSENSSKRLSSTHSEKTSRSSNYDGSIIIKLVT